MRTELDGCVALVTGRSNGIGRVRARALAEETAQTVIVAGGFTVQVPSGPFGRDVSGGRLCGDLI